MMNQRASPPAQIRQTVSDLVEAQATCSHLRAQLQLLPQTTALEVEAPSCPASAAARNLPLDADSHTLQVVPIKAPVASILHNLKSCDHIVRPCLVWDPYEAGTPPTAGWYQLCTMIPSDVHNMDQLLFSAEG